MVDDYSDQPSIFYGWFSILNFVSTWFGKVGRSEPATNTVREYQRRKLLLYLGNISFNVPTPIKCQGRVGNSNPVYTGKLFTSPQRANLQPSVPLAHWAILSQLFQPNHWIKLSGNGVRTGSTNFLLRILFSFFRRKERFLE